MARRDWVTANRAAWGLALLELCAEPVLFCEAVAPGERPHEIVSANPAAIDLLNIQPGELPQPLARYLEPRAWGEACWCEGFNQREGLGWSGDVAGPSGQQLPIEVRAWALPQANAGEGRVAWVVLLRPRIRAEEEVRNHVRSLETQLLHAHKMEAMGRLAGGVAHDFNNLLTVINGHCELLLRRAGLDEPLQRDLQEIRSAGERASNLTRQLLTFSRRQRQQPKLLDPAVILTDLQKMLVRLLGEDIEIHPNLGHEIGMIYVDPGQFEQMVLNLAINARDAMPRGGVLRLELSTMRTRHEVRWNEALIPPGEFVRLSVSDTGQGIEPDVLQHIFEPFFTTKEAGRGTGLGLSIVYGIVLQSGGFIEVDSTPGQGSSFSIHLPRMMRVDHRQAAEAEAPRLQHQGETIMVVEDDPMVRRLVHQLLQMHGYQVVLADGGEEALRLSDQTALRIDLLITDLVLPRMNGLQLAERLREARAGLRVLLMSGYSAACVQQVGALPPDLDYLPKPFTAKGLEQKVREILDRKSA